jgi:hypothetical protein
MERNMGPLISRPGRMTDLSGRVFILTATGFTRHRRPAPRIITRNISAKQLETIPRNHEEAEIAEPGSETSCLNLRIQMCGVHPMSVS